jgi:hypothetical protein
MSQDYYFLNADENDGNKKSLNPSIQDNVTPAQALDMVVQGAVQEFERVTNTGPYTVKLQLYDKEAASAANVRLYTLDSVGNEFSELANNDVLEAVGIFNAVIPRIQLLKQMLLMAESLHDDHTELYAEKISNIGELAIKIRNLILVLLDMINTMSFTLRHKFEYDQLQLMLLELDEQQDTEEDGGSSDSSDDGDIQQGD